MRVLKMPQWSLSMMVERTMVKAGDEKKMAVASPNGKMLTALIKVKYFGSSHPDSGKNV